MDHGGRSSPVAVRLLSGSSHRPTGNERSIPAGAVDDATLCDELQKETFGYFLHEFNSATGLIADKTASGSSSSIAAVGLALSSFPVGVQRKLLDREAAVRRVETTLEFLWNAPRGEEPDASGYRGFFYHFLDMETGRGPGIASSRRSTARFSSPAPLRRLHISIGHPSRSSGSASLLG